MKKPYRHFSLNIEERRSIPFWGLGSLLFINFATATTIMYYITFNFDYWLNAVCLVIGAVYFEIRFWISMNTKRINKFEEGLNYVREKFRENERQRSRKPTVQSEQAAPDQQGSMPQQLQTLEQPKEEVQV